MRSEQQQRRPPSPGRDAVAPISIPPGKRQRDLSLTLFVAAVLLFGYPLLSIAPPGLTLFGVPAPYLYLFAGWLLLIVLLAALAERGLR